MFVSKMLTATAMNESYDSLSKPLSEFFPFFLNFCRTVSDGMWLVEKR
jgi:hypothetical protein